MKQNIAQTIHQLQQRVDEAFQEAIKKTGLTVRQFSILSAIREASLPSQTDLVGLTGTDRSTMADIVRRLQKRGLIQRKRKKEDARAYVVGLTLEGVKLLESADKAASSVEDSVFEPLGRAAGSRKERALFLDILERLTEPDEEQDSDSAAA